MVRGCVDDDGRLYPSGASGRMKPICCGRPSIELGTSTTSCGSALNGPGVVTLLDPRSSQSSGYGTCACAAPGSAERERR